MPAVGDLLLCKETLCFFDLAKTVAFLKGATYAVVGSDVSGLVCIDETGQRHWLGAGTSSWLPYFDNVTKQETDMMSNTIKGLGIEALSELVALLHKSELKFDARLDSEGSWIVTLTGY